MVNDQMVNLIGLLIPFLGTMLGSAFVFFMRQDMPVRLQKALLGFASGVMVAASVWSLLIPAIEAEAAKGPRAVMPAAVGFLLGILFLLAIDELTPHLHVGANTPEGPRSRLSRTAMLALAGHPFQPLHHRFRPRLCPHDDPRCGVGIVWHATCSK